MTSAAALCSVSTPDIKAGDNNMGHNFSGLNVCFVSGSSRSCRGNNGAISDFTGIVLRSRKVPLVFVFFIYFTYMFLYMVIK